MRNVAAILIIGLIAGAAYLRFYKRSPALYGAAHAVANTMQDLQDVEAAIQLLSIESPSSLPTNHVLLDGARLYSLLTNSPQAIALAHLSPRSGTRKQVLDSWDQPVSAEFIQTDTNYMVKLCSSGPPPSQGQAGHQIVRQSELTVQHPTKPRISPK